MDEIVSAAELINRSAGSIYLCLRQSCWEMGTPKWESTACFSSPRPHQVISPPLPFLLKATREERLINIKRVESRLALPSGSRHNPGGHFNVFCPNLKQTWQIRLSCQNFPAWWFFFFLFLNQTSVISKSFSSNLPMLLHLNSVCMFLLPDQGFFFYTWLMAGLLWRRKKKKNGTGAILVPVPRRLAFWLCLHQSHLVTASAKDRIEGTDLFAGKMVDGERRTGTRGCNNNTQFQASLWFVSHLAPWWQAPSWPGF